MNRSSSSPPALNYLLFLVVLLLIGIILLSVPLDAFSQEPCDLIGCEESLSPLIVDSVPISAFSEFNVAGSNL
jgi:hypothetical protein